MRPRQSSPCARATRGGAGWRAHLNLEKVLGRPVDLVEALLARVRHGLHDGPMQVGAPGGRFRAGRGGLVAGSPSGFLLARQFGGCGGASWLGAPMVARARDPASWLGRSVATELRGAVAAGRRCMCVRDGARRLGLGARVMRLEVVEVGRDGGRRSGAVELVVDRCGCGGVTGPHLHNRLEQQKNLGRTALKRVRVVDGVPVRG